MLAALTIVCLGLGTSAAAVQGGDAAKVLKEMEGSWTVVSMEFQGKKIPDEKVKELNLQMVFKGDKYSQHTGGKLDEEGTLKLDPSKKPPTIDLSIETGKDKGKTQLGVYELKGDTLRVSLARPGSTDRPKSLAGDDGLITFKRDKK
jgi:uncharacterized protein (TIGR03067 family)